MKKYTIKDHADALPAPPAGYKWKRTKKGEKIQEGMGTYVCFDPLATLSGLDSETTSSNLVGTKLAYVPNYHFWYLVRDKSIKLHNHMFDLAASIETPHEDFYKIPVANLIAAMRKRLDYLEKNPNDCGDAFGFCDKYEVPK